MHYAPIAQTDATTPPVVSSGGLRATLPSVTHAPSLPDLRSPGDAVRLRAGDCVSCQGTGVEFVEEHVDTAGGVFVTTYGDFVASFASHPASPTGTSHSRKT